MRVRTYHTHTINRSSPLLGALVTINAAYSLCFALPVVAVSLGKKWSSGITSGQQVWCASTVALWSAAEILRLYFGYRSNLQQFVPGLLLFALLTLLPQLPLVAVFNSIWPQRDSLDYALSITLIIMLLFEFLCSVRLVATLMQNNRIDFFVYGRYLTREDHRF
ncbi:hypothetical protein DQ04_02991020 [Trypanosoma grayi]|uniref:hypothetical protein n=1 Tax=Trypanosoma grayi TaxID=71804 RepID=UPI0004F4AC26|nr:hypothetical protein DQ04_02991020 [Trypanosoma grayi]KEG11086.1 hypothetical protein DQ04_02991020 [Trypanosoma grayi]